MKRYLTVLIGLLLSSFSNGQDTFTKNEIEFLNYGITKKQSEFLFSKIKSFLNNTQLSIALIKKVIFKN
jgi:hypothetical protein